MMCVLQRDDAEPRRCPGKVKAAKIWPASTALRQHHGQSRLAAHLLRSKAKKGRIAISKGRLAWSGFVAAEFEREAPEPKLLLKIQERHGFTSLKAVRYEVRRRSLFRPKGSEESLAKMEWMGDDPRVTDRHYLHFKEGDFSSHKR
jgi:hypothetical protein